MVYTAYDYGYDNGYSDGKRDERRIGDFGIKRRDEIIANQAKTIERITLREIAAVSKLAEENAALSARLGELATASPKPIIGAYPVKPLGKNLKPYQPEPPKVGDSVRLTPKGGPYPEFNTLAFIVSAVYPNLINGVHVVSRGSGKFYNLNDYTWEVK